MYFVASSIFIVATLTAVVGILFRLPIFLNKRLVALGVLFLLAFLAPAVNALRTPEQVKEEAAIDQTVKSFEAEGKAKDNLSIDAMLNPDMAEINGTITNHSDVTYKNVKAKCIFSGESGKKINTLKIEILKVAKANADTKFSGISAGYIDSQAVRFNCIVTDAERSYSASAS